MPTNYEIKFVVCPKCGAYMLTRHTLVNHYITKITYLCYCGNKIELLEHNLDNKYRKLEK